MPGERSSHLAHDRSQLGDAGNACELVDSGPRHASRNARLHWHRPARPAVGRLIARRGGVRRQKIASDLVGQVGIEPTTQEL